ncbi:hypothetical protein D9M68_810280 [compost metagenome]
MPGAEDREYAEQAGEDDHQDRQAIQRQVHADAETFDPLHLEFRGPERIGSGNRGPAEIAGGPQP